MTNPHVAGATSRASIPTFKGTGTLLLIVAEDLILISCDLRRPTVVHIC